MSDRLQILLMETSTDDAQRVISRIHSSELNADIQHLETGEAWTSQLERRHFDIILCNFQLLCVLDVLATVRRMRLDIPVIVLSDTVGDELAVSVMHAGAHDFVTKSNLSRLVPAIERELEELAIHHQNHAAQLALRESEERFRQLTENIGEVFWLINARSGEMIYLSPAFEDVWEQHSSLMLNDPTFLLDTVHPEDFHKVQKALKEHGWLGFNEEYRIVLQDGESRWISTTSFPIRSDEGEIYRVAGLSVDIGEYKRLAEEREMLSRALEQSADAVMITDVQGRIVYVNGAFEELSGYRKEEILGLNPSFLKSGFQDEAFYSLLWQNIANGISFTDIFINRRKDGELYYEAKTITPVRGSNGELTHFVSTGKDITDRLKTRQRLEKLVHYDAVTGLANRVLLQERMEQAIIQAKYQDSAIGVMCVALEVSGLLGGVRKKKLSEKLLYGAAQRLTEKMPANVTAARLGTNEFVLLLKDVSGQKELERVAKALVLAFGEPVIFDGYELYLTPAVGISLFPGDGIDSDTLIKNAETAMHHVSRHEQRGYGFYHGGMESRPKHLQ